MPVLPQRHKHIFPLLYLLQNFLKVGIPGAIIFKQEAQVTILGHYRHRHIIPHNTGLNKMTHTISGNMHQSRLLAVKAETPLNAVIIHCLGNSLCFSERAAHSNKVISLHGCNGLVA